MIDFVNLNMKQTFLMFPQNATPDDLWRGFRDLNQHRSLRIIILAAEELTTALLKWVRSTDICDWFWCHCSVFVICPQANIADANVKLFLSSVHRQTLQMPMLNYFCHLFSGKQCRFSAEPTWIFHPLS